MILKTYFPFNYKGFRTWQMIVNDIKCCSEVGFQVHAVVERNTSIVVEKPFKSRVVGYGHRLIL